MKIKAFLPLMALGLVLCSCGTTPSNGGSADPLNGMSVITKEQFKTGLSGTIAYQAANPVQKLTAEMTGTTDGQTAEAKVLYDKEARVQTRETKIGESMHVVETYTKTSEYGYLIAAVQMANGETPITQKLYQKMSLTDYDTYFDANVPAEMEEEQLLGVSLEGIMESIDATDQENVSFTFMGNIQKNKYSVRGLETRLDTCDDSTCSPNQSGSLEITLVYQDNRLVYFHEVAKDGSTITEEMAATVDYTAAVSVPLPSLEGFTETTIVE